MTTSAAASHALSILLNGQAIETRAGTLAALVAAQGHGETRIATAVNGEFVPVARRAATALAEGDRIEILTARQGG